MQFGLIVFVKDIRRDYQLEIERNGQNKTV